MSWKRGLLLLAIGLVVLFAAVRESREPYMWLFLDDLLHPKPAPHTVALSEGLDVRLYADTRPHTGKIARLQKGLALVVDGQERIEEGFGFGLPLVEVDGRAYLSRSASVERDGDTLVKRYDIDMLDTPSGLLRRKYEPVPPLGTVTVSYSLAARDTIGVTVDVSELQVAWDRIYLMNEQGARFFTRYEEAGLAVEGEALGKWQPTTTGRSCIVAGDRSLRFCVETDGETPRYYGRERYNQYYWIGIYALSWAGIELVLDPASDRFAYQIRIERPDRE